MNVSEYTTIKIVFIGQQKKFKLVSMVEIKQQVLIELYVVGIWYGKVGLFY